MAKRDLLDDDILESERSDYRELEWTVAKTLLDANAHTVRAFEQHLLRTYRETDSTDLESIRSNLGRAIDEHEKIIEDLEAARSAVSAIQDDPGSETFDE